MACVVTVKNLNVLLTGQDIPMCIPSTEQKNSEGNG